MSTQRRRVLENDGGKTTITDNGVYIEGLNGKFYTVDNWKGGNDANSVAVASGDVKFRIALTQAPSTMQISEYKQDPLEDYMKGLNYDAALSDYDGAGNTTKIMQMEYSTGYAAGYCNAFTFPDGKTKGFLPSLGQLNLVYQNKAAVDAALTACGGAVFKASGDYPYNYYWSSTFWGVSGDYRYCWWLRWDDGQAYYALLRAGFYVRPFADIS